MRARVMRNELHRPQVGWILQLVAASRRWVLHVDGKHKLHHGKWMLVTFGTHMLRHSWSQKKLTHSFRPLVYMFCKGHEDAESLLFGMHALEQVACMCGIMSTE